VVLGLNSGPTLEPFYKSFILKSYFKIGSHKIFVRAGFQLLILLISAAWVPGIIGMSHWCPAVVLLFFKNFYRDILVIQGANSY
jgi:hypothetical protein